MAKGVNDVAEEVARIQITQGFGSDSKDLEFFSHG